MTTKEKRTTTVHNRFEISCSYCGRLYGEKSLFEAKVSAKRAATLHNQADEAISIYDIMAHRGCTCSWDADGRPIGRVLL